MNTIFPKYFKHSLIRIVSFVTILSFVFSNIAFALPASPSGGPDTLRQQQPLQQDHEVVYGLSGDLSEGSLGAQVANIKSLDNLLRILHVLKKSDDWPSVMEGTPDWAIMQQIIFELDKLGLIEVTDGQEGIDIVKISDEVRDMDLGIAIQLWVLNTEGGVRAINFRGGNGIWKIVGFESHLTPDVLKHEKTEIAFRQEGKFWIEAHNLTVDKLGKGKKINPEEAKTYYAGRQEEIGAAGEGEPKLSIPDQMRLAEGETDFAKELRGDVPQIPAQPDIKAQVDAAIAQADQAVKAMQTPPATTAQSMVQLPPTDNEPYLFVGSTGDEEFEPFHSAVLRAQEIYEQGGKTQEAAQKASDVLIAYLIKMHNMEYPVNIEYAIFILKNAGNPDLLPIAAVLEEFQAGPKDDASELLTNLKAAIIASLQEELRGLREQELTLTRTDNEVVLKIPTYLRRQELDKINQRRDEINAQIGKIRAEMFVVFKAAQEFLKAVDNWQESEEWQGISSVTDKGIQVYVVNLPADYSEPEVLLTSLRRELGYGVNIVVKLRGTDEETLKYYDRFNSALGLGLTIEAIEPIDEQYLKQALRMLEIKLGEKHLFIVEKENLNVLASEEAILTTDGYESLKISKPNLKVALVQKTDLEQPTDASRRILNLLFGPKQVDVITPETITGEDLRQELTTALAALRKA